MIPACAIAVAAAASTGTAVVRSLFRARAAIATVSSAAVALLGGALLFTPQLRIEAAQRSIQPAIDLRPLFRWRLRDARVGAAIATGAAGARLSFCARASRRR